MSSLSLNLLGPFEAFSNGETITELRSSKAQALLIYLAVEKGTAHRRESLFTLLWPGMPEKSARHNLRQVLYSLRQIFPEVAAVDGDETVPLLLSGRQTIQINPQAAGTVDVHQVNQLLDETQVHDHLALERCARCIKALNDAVDLYQGEFLSNFYLEDSNEFEDWATATREAYQRKVLEALQTLSDIATSNENFEQAKEYAERQLEIDPLKESAHRQLMENLARNGQRAAALQQYRSCEKILKDELGVAPSTKTILLHEQIRTESLRSPEADRSTLQPLSTPRHNLPHPLTSFIGRQREIAEITQLIKDHRLVTLTGAGGIGKTQLSLQVGQRLLDAFPDGVWLVELSSIADPALIPNTAAYALRLLELPGRPTLEILLDYLQDKYSLLILDNCEHLINETANFVERVLLTCPKLKLLANSRETLGVPGEVPYQVQPLSFPVAGQAPSFEEWKQYDAMRLFAERAAVVLPDFQVTQDNLTPLAKICQQLDGIPLALELAAVRVKILTIEQIASRLDDRFRLLTGGSRTVLPRQQTLRASIDWSWKLLSTAEQGLLRRLSVFAGEINLEAVEGICATSDINKAQILDLLAQLVNKSLVIVEREPGEETRYRILETIRQYGGERLVEMDEEEIFRDRHLDYFMQLGIRGKDELVGPDQISWMNNLEKELDNIRIAMKWARESNIEAGLQLITTTWRFWAHGHAREGEAWLSQFLTQADGVELSIRAKALWVQGRFNYYSLLNDDLAQRLVEESLTLYRELGNQQGVGRCLGLLGFEAGSTNLSHFLEGLTLLKAEGDKLGVAEVLLRLGYAVWKDDYGQAMVYLEESESLYREVGHLAGIADVLGNYGAIAIWRGDNESARSKLEESLDLRESLGLRGSTNSLTNLGILYFRQGEYERARGYFEKSLSISQQTGDRMSGYWASVSMGYLFLRMGEFSQAQTILVKCQQQFKLVDQSSGVTYATEGLASLAVAQRQAEKAAQLFGWADATREKVKDTRPPVEQADVDRDTATILEMIGKETYAAAYAEGQSLTMDQAIAYASGDD